jgi:DNA polymerase-3 subunit delta'
MTYPWLSALESEFGSTFRGERVPHAILLSGEAGTGKSELGRRMMAGLLCLEERFPACGSCRSCRLLESGAHPDGHIVTFEAQPGREGVSKEIRVDQIRRLNASLQLTNTISRRKAALVFPAEAMNRNAANALLKTLEEPPGDAVLLLVAHRPSRLPATIRSRCQTLHVRIADLDSVRIWLAEATGSEEEDANAALEAAAGSPLRAKQMLQEGAVETFRTVGSTLDRLREGRCELSAALSELLEVEPEHLWTWLSLRAAQETRTTLEPALANLQSEADRNRFLLSTPVRKDLLLQDWLIQWARLSA